MTAPLDPMAETNPGEECWHEAHPWCPYCGHKMTDVWEDAMSGDDECTEVECGECERTFTITTHISTNYTTKAKEPTDV